MYKSYIQICFPHTRAPRPVDCKGMKGMRPCGGNTVAQSYSWQLQTGLLMTRGGSSIGIAEQERPSTTVRAESPYCITERETHVRHKRKYSTYSVCTQNQMYHLHPSFALCIAYFLSPDMLFSMHSHTLSHDSRASKTRNFVLEILCVPDAWCRIVKPMVPSLSKYYSPVPTGTISF